MVLDRIGRLVRATYSGIRDRAPRVSILSNEAGELNFTAEMSPGEKRAAEREARMRAKHGK